MTTLRNIWAQRQNSINKSKDFDGEVIEQREAEIYEELIRRN